MLGEKNLSCEITYHKSDNYASVCNEPAYVCLTCTFEKTTLGSESKYTARPPPQSCRSQRMQNETKLLIWRTRRQRKSHSLDRPTAEQRAYLPQPTITIVTYVFSTPHNRPMRKYLTISITFGLSDHRRTHIFVMAVR